MEIYNIRSIQVDLVVGLRQRLLTDRVIMVPPGGCFFPNSYLFYNLSFLASDLSLAWLKKMHGDINQPVGLPIHVINCQKLSMSTLVHNCYESVYVTALIGAIDKTFLNILVLSAVHKSHQNAKLYSSCHRKVKITQKTKVARVLIH